MRQKGAQKGRKFAGAVFCFSGAQPRNSAEVQSRAENIKERRDERRLLQEEEDVDDQDDEETQQQQQENHCHAMSSEIAEATTRRAAILRKLAVELARIHDPTLSEPQLRDTNDTINTLLGKRRGVERAIKKMGGPDYSTSALPNSSSKDSVTIKGYKYFGRAKELPDVVNLLKEAEKEQQKAKSAKNIKERLKAFKNPNNWKKYPISLNVSEAPHMDMNGETALTSIDFTKAKDVQKLLEDSQRMHDFLIKRKKTLLLQRIKANRTSKA
jgi:pre-mRNA-splicing factor ISY1